MSEFETKLNAILGNSEAMGQIMALAQSLSGNETQAENPADTPEEEYTPVAASQSDQAPVQAPDLSALLGGIEPKMMQVGMRLLQEYNRKDDRNTALLTALRPFVKEERFEKVDRAIQIARLARVIRILFDVLKEREGGSYV